MSVALPILDTAVQRPNFALGPRDLASVKLLRISVTDRCNLRCVYCMPETGVPFAQRDDLLTADDVLAVARAARAVGIDHFKITGGEPTIHREVIDIVRHLADLGPRDLSLTTNALRLDQLAKPLYDAGLDRLTVSLDTMHADRFDRISGGRYGERGLDQVWRGIEAATRAGFEKLKINCVVIGGINDDEVVEFARFTQDRPWTVRFIEYMPLGESVLVDQADHYTVDNAQIATRIESELGPLQPVHRHNEVGVGPAQVFALAGARGRVGFISAMSRPFCETCNRLRLTATGELRSCLFDGGEVNVLPALRPRPDEQRVIEMMRTCVQFKPDVHAPRGGRAMSQLGG